MITSPHEFVAMSAAQGYAQVTGKLLCNCTCMIASIHLHILMTDRSQNKVECGTFNCGGAFHNGLQRTYSDSGFCRCQSLYSRGRASRQSHRVHSMATGFKSQRKKNPNLIFCAGPMIKRVSFADTPSTMLN